MKHLFVLSLVCLLQTSDVFAESARPNIVLILADDLAWSDVGCYGHAWHQTPHIDRLANEGLRFTNGYSPAPICSASRASILTGKTVGRTRFEFVTKNEPGFQKIDTHTLLKAPPLRLNLPLKEKTIAESLNELGYQTAFFGKWHVSSHHKRYLGWSPTHGPKQQGFQVAEEDFGSHPYSWNKQNPQQITTKGEYPQDSMINRATAFLKQKHQQPYFLMVSLFYVHTPVKTQCPWLYEKYDALVPADSPNREKRVTYGAFVETMDHQVGEILKALDESGQAEETLVVFLSDNGGHPEFAANAPLRGSKWNLYEGGIRVPFIMRWPQTIEPDRVSKTPVIGYDLLPTFVDLANGKVQDIDGVSLTPLFKDTDWSPTRDLIWHFPYYHPEQGYKAAQESIGVNDYRVSKTKPQSALRRGNQKLLYFYEDDRTELYDLSQDPGEHTDQSKSDSQWETELRKALKTHLKESSARLPVLQK